MAKEQSEGVSGWKILRGDIKGRGFLLNWLNRIHDKSRPRAQTSGMGDEEPHQTARVIRYNSAGFLIQGPGPAKDRMRVRSRPSREQGSEKPSLTTVWSRRESLSQLPANV